MVRDQRRPHRSIGFAASVMAILVVASVADTAIAATAPAVDDVLRSNPVGEPTVVEVLLNDEPDVVPSTLALIDPDTGDPADEVVVPGEGTWSLVVTWHVELRSTTRNVQFLADPGFVGDPTPVEYVVTDASGAVGRASITLTFQDVARSDVSLGNVVGSKVVVDVLANDDPTVGNTRVSASFRELLADDIGRVGNWIDFAVPGEGEWEPRSSGTVEFFPAPGFRGNPSPQEYSVLDSAGNEYFAGVVVGYAGLDPDDVLLNNPIGAPVSIDVFGNDPVGFDAATLMLLDPVSGQAEGTIDVAGEGRWTIAPDLRVTFTPELGFVGDPTPLEYTVDDASGSPTDAAITLTFQDLVRNDCSLGNLPGRDVAIDVLDNDDDGSLNLNTLAMSGPLRERRLPGATREATYRDDFYISGQGWWKVDSVNGRILFEPDFRGARPVPQEYSVLDADGVEHFGTITVTYEGMAAPPETACRQVLATVPPTTVPTTTIQPATELPETGDSSLPAVLLAGALVALGTVLVRRSS